MATIIPDVAQLSATDPRPVVLDDEQLVQVSGGAVNEPVQATSWEMCKRGAAGSGPEMLKTVGQTLPFAAMLKYVPGIPKWVSPLALAFAPTVAPAANCWQGMNDLNAAQNPVKP